MKDFAGRVAVVTGAASGMGLAMATRFAQEGMKVVLADVEEPALEAAVVSPKRQEHDVTGVVTNVASLPSIEALAEQTLSAYGKVHILCNNAGVGGLFSVPIWDTTDKDWQWTLGVNLMGAVHGIRTFVPIMLAQGEEGHVVSTASNAGLLPGSRVYGVTKHAVVALMEALYSNLKGQGAPISCSVLCPGVVKTQMPFAYRNRPADLLNDVDVRDAPAERELQDRIVKAQQEIGMEPEDVASMVLEAIRDDQFWILTHSDTEAGVIARAQDIVARRNPPSRPHSPGSNDQ